MHCTCLGLIPATDLKHPDLHLMSVAVAVNVAAGSLRE